MHTRPNDSENTPFLIPLGIVLAILERVVDIKLRSQYQVQIRILECPCWICFIHISWQDHRQNRKCMKSWKEKGTSIALLIINEQMDII